MEEDYWIVCNFHSDFNYPDNLGWIKNPQLLNVEDKKFLEKENTKFMCKMCLNRFMNREHKNAFDVSEIIKNMEKKDGFNIVFEKLDKSISLENERIPPSDYRLWLNGDIFKGLEKNYSLKRMTSRKRSSRKKYSKKNKKRKSKSKNKKRRKSKK